MMPATAEDLYVDHLCRFIAANKFMPLPPEDNFAGRNYLQVGVGLMKMMIDAGLKPGSNILDFGCGMGRLAMPLTQYLTSGKYVGLDINLSGIAWCHENIERRYPNFRFILLNVKNRHYGSRFEYGTEPATSLELPKSLSGSFDYVAAFSLFTHLTREDTEAYFRIIHGLLKPGATFIASMFLINDEAKAGIRAGKSKYNFHIDDDGPDFYLSANKSAYSQAIGYSDGYIRELADASGFDVAAPMVYSGWHEGREGQDAIRLTRR